MSFLTLRNANIVNNCIMKNREQQILSEIRQMISSIHSQLEILEEKLELLETDTTETVMEDVPAEVFEEAVVEVEATEEAKVEVVEEVQEDLLEEAPIEIDIEDVMEDFTVTEVPDVEAVDLPDEVTDVEAVAEVPVGEDLPEGEILIDAAAAALKPAVIDTMTNKEAWRTDIPGSAVKDIRSAISLNDRILFINSLFDEDPMLFQAVLTRINSMSSLDEAVGYIKEERPSWDMESDEVYRFMMAVRRRIQ